MQVDQTAKPWREIFRVHPACEEIFQPLPPDELRVLGEDIQANGLKDKIDLIERRESPSSVVYTVIDGRSRLDAMAAVGMKIDFLDDLGDPKYELFHIVLHEDESDDDFDPIAHVVSKNLKRRHLNDDQRRMVAAKIANMGQGRPSENPALCGVKIVDAAGMVNVDIAGVERARTVIRTAEPEIRNAVEHGHLTVNLAAQAAKLPVEQQRAIATEAEAGRANVVRNVVKKAARADREAELGAKQIAMPTRQYGVILEDFEWDDTVYSRDTGMARHASNHYETSETAHTAEEIVERTKERFACAAEDCVVFSWTTIQHLAIALDVMKLRGFTYKSHHVWAKPHISLGRWVRAKHEILLIGTRGKVPCPAPGTQWESLVSAPHPGSHSAKPDAFYEMIEGYFPTLPKIELNARRARAGWDRWGNEAPPVAAMSAVVADDAPAPPF
jgi:N6-adenosine-specific RNA methylase IME4